MEDSVKLEIQEKSVFEMGIIEAFKQYKVSDIKTSLQLPVVFVAPRNHLPLLSFFLQYTVLFILIILFSKSISSHVSANTSPVLIPV